MSGRPPQLYRPEADLAGGRTVYGDPSSRDYSFRFILPAERNKILTAASTGKRKPAADVALLGLTQTNAEEPVTGSYRVYTLDPSIKYADQLELTESRTATKYNVNLDNLRILNFGSANLSTSYTNLRTWLESNKTEREIGLDKETKLSKDSYLARLFTYRLANVYNYDGTFIDEDEGDDADGEQSPAKKTRKRRRKRVARYAKPLTGMNYTNVMFREAAAQWRLKFAVAWNKDMAALRSENPAFQPVHGYTYTRNEKVRVGSDSKGKMYTFRYLVLFDDGDTLPYGVSSVSGTRDQVNTFDENAALEPDHVYPVLDDATIESMRRTAPNAFVLDDKGKSADYYTLSEAKQNLMCENFESRAEEDVLKDQAGFRKLRTYPTHQLVYREMCEFACLICDWMLAGRLNSAVALMRQHQAKINDKDGFARILGPAFVDSLVEIALVTPYAASMLAAQYIQNKYYGEEPLWSRISSFPHEADVWMEEVVRPLVLRRASQYSIRDFDDIVGGGGRIGSLSVTVDDFARIVRSAIGSSARYASRIPRGIAQVAPELAAVRMEANDAVGQIFAAIDNQVHGMPRGDAREAVVRFALEGPSREQEDDAAEIPQAVVDALGGAEQAAQVYGTQTAVENVRMLTAARETDILSVDTPIGGDRGDRPRMDLAVTQPAMQRANLTDGDARVLGMVLVRGGDSARFVSGANATPGGRIALAALNEQPIMGQLRTENSTQLASLDPNNVIRGQANDNPLAYDTKYVEHATGRTNSERERSRARADAMQKNADRLRELDRRADQGLYFIESDEDSGDGQFFFGRTAEPVTDDEALFIALWLGYIRWRSFIGATTFDAFAKGLDKFSVLREVEPERLEELYTEINAADSDTKIRVDATDDLSDEDDEDDEFVTANEFKDMQAAYGDALKDVTIEANPQRAQIQKRRARLAADILALRNETLGKLAPFVDQEAGDTNLPQELYSRALEQALRGNADVREIVADYRARENALRQAAESDIARLESPADQILRVSTRQRVLASLRDIVSANIGKVDALLNLDTSGDDSPFAWHSRNNVWDERGNEMENMYPDIGARKPKEVFDTETRQFLYEKQRLSTHKAGYMQKFGEKLVSFYMTIFFGRIGDKDDALKKENVVRNWLRDVGVLPMPLQTRDDDAKEDKVVQKSTGKILAPTNVGVIVYDSQIDSDGAAIEKFWKTHVLRTKKQKGEDDDAYAERVERLQSARTFEFVGHVEETKIAYMEAMLAVRYQVSNNDTMLDLLRSPDARTPTHYTSPAGMSFNELKKGITKRSFSAFVREIYDNVRVGNSDGALRFDQVLGLSDELAVMLNVDADKIDDYIGDMYDLGVRRGIKATKSIQDPTKQKEARELNRKIRNARKITTPILQAMQDAATNISFWNQTEHITANEDAYRLAMPTWFSVMSMLRQRWQEEASESKGIIYLYHHAKASYQIMWRLFCLDMRVPRLIADPKSTIASEIRQFVVDRHVLWGRARGTLHSYFSLLSEGTGRLQTPWLVFPASNYTPFAMLNQFRRALRIPSTLPIDQTDMALMGKLSEAFNSPLTMRQWRNLHGDTLVDATIASFNKQVVGEEVSRIDIEESEGVCFIDEDTDDEDDREVCITPDADTEAVVVETKKKAPKRKSKTTGGHRAPSAIRLRLAALIASDERRDMADPTADPLNVMIDRIYNNTFYDESALKMSVRTRETAEEEIAKYRKKLTGIANFNEAKDASKIERAVEFATDLLDAEPDMTAFVTATELDIDDASGKQGLEESRKYGMRIIYPGQDLAFLPVQSTAAAGQRTHDILNQYNQMEHAEAVSAKHSTEFALANLTMGAIVFGEVYESVCAEIISNLNTLRDRISDVNANRKPVSEVRKIVANLRKDIDDLSKIVQQFNIALQGPTSAAFASLISLGMDNPQPTIEGEINKNKMYSIRKYISGDAWKSADNPFYMPPLVADDGTVFAFQRQPTIPQFVYMRIFPSYWNNMFKFDESYADNVVSIATGGERFTTNYPNLYAAVASSGSKRAAKSKDKGKAQTKRDRELSEERSTGETDEDSRPAKKARFDFTPDEDVQMTGSSMRKRGMRMARAREFIAHAADHFTFAKMGLFLHKSERATAKARYGCVHTSDFAAQAEDFVHALDMAGIPLTHAVFKQTHLNIADLRTNLETYDARETDERHMVPQSVRKSRVRLFKSAMAGAVMQVHGPDTFKIYNIAAAACSDPVMQAAKTLYKRGSAGDYNMPYAAFHSLVDPAGEQVALSTEDRIRIKEAELQRLVPKHGVDDTTLTVLNEMAALYALTRNQRSPEVNDKINGLLLDLELAMDEYNSAKMTSLFTQLAAYRHDTMVRTASGMQVAKRGRSTGTLVDRLVQVLQNAGDKLTRVERVQVRNVVNTYRENDEEWTHRATTLLQKYAF